MSSISDIGKANKNLKDEFNTKNVLDTLAAVHRNMIFISKNASIALGNKEKVDKILQDTEELREEVSRIKLGRQIDFKETYLKQDKDQPPMGVQDAF